MHENDLRIINAKGPTEDFHEIVQTWFKDLVLGIFVAFSVLTRNQDLLKIEMSRKLIRFPVLGSAVQKG